MSQKGPKRPQNRQLAAALWEVKMKSQHPHRRFPTSNKAEWPGNSPHISRRGPHRPRLRGIFPQNRFVFPNGLGKATVAIPSIHNPLRAIRRKALATRSGPELLRACALGGICAEGLQRNPNCSAQAHSTAEHPNIILRNIMQCMGVLKNPTPHQK